MYLDAKEASSFGGIQVRAFYVRPTQADQGKNRGVKRWAGIYKALSIWSNWPDWPMHPTQWRMLCSENAITKGALQALGSMHYLPACDHKSARVCEPQAYDICKVIYSLLANDPTAVCLVGKLHGWSTFHAMLLSYSLDLKAQAHKVSLQRAQLMDMQHAALLSAVTREVIHPSRRRLARLAGSWEVENYRVWQRPGQRPWQRPG